MNQHELINKALELGFSAAALIDTKDIIFRPEFRVCCEDNSCGMYGVNYACPPACGTTDEMKERVLAHKKAFMIAASGCSVCPECSIVKNEPCRFPDLKASCVSAYCIYVQELAEKLGWDYDLGQGLVAYFGMYVFH